MPERECAHSAMMRGIKPTPFKYNSCAIRWIAMDSMNGCRKRNQEQEGQGELLKRNGIGTQVKEGQVLRPDQLFEITEVVGDNDFNTINEADVLGGQARLLRGQSDGAENGGEHKEGPFFVK